VAEGGGAGQEAKVEPIVDKLDLFLTFCMGNTWSRLEKRRLNKKEKKRSLTKGHQRHQTQRWHHSYTRVPRRALFPLSRQTGALCSPMFVRSAHLIRSTACWGARGRRLLSLPCTLGGDLKQGGYTRQLIYPMTTLVAADSDGLGHCQPLIGMKLAKGALDTRKETAVPRPRRFIN